MSICLICGNKTQIPDVQIFFAWKLIILISQLIYGFNNHLEIILQNSMGTFLKAENMVNKALKMRSTTVKFYILCSDILEIEKLDYFSPQKFLSYYVLLVESIRIPSEDINLLAFTHALLHTHNFMYEMSSHSGRIIILVSSLQLIFTALRF